LAESERVPPLVSANAAASFPDFDQVTHSSAP
jgi:hypothetical protein